MKRARLVVEACAAAAAIAVGGCGEAERLAAPELKLGRDQCRECGMIISEDRCCSALIVEDGGYRETELFDDIGCMLDRERGAKDLRVAARYFRDYEKRAWIETAEAWFVWNEEIHTPMASGIVAFGERPRAETAGKEGRVYSRDEIRAQRASWMEERYGKPPER